MTFEQICKANQTIKQIDVKGKMYSEVSERLKAFRQVEPNGGVITEIISLDNGTCVMKATVLDGNGNVLGVGHAYEKENSSYINKTSFIENCETSAVGRALGMCGFGIDTAISSYEEVTNVEAQKKGSTKGKSAPKQGVQKMVEAFKKNFGVSAENIENRLEKPIDEITDADFLVMKDIFNSLKNKETNVGDWFDIKGKTSLGSDL